MKELTASDFKKAMQAIVASAKKRKPSWYVKEVRRRVALAPNEPIPMDIFPKEEESFDRAIASLKTDDPGWTCALCGHPDKLARDEGILRVVFYGPKYKHPRPIKTVTLPREGTRSAREKAGRETQELLQEKYGSDVRVTLSTDLTPPGIGCICEVWRMGAWLKKEMAMLFPTEVVAILEKRIKFQHCEHTLKMRRDQCRRVAPRGGKETAHYTDDAVAKAFTDFKRRNDGKSAWDAATALIRKGQPLSKWKHVNSAWNRVKRIAASTQGLSVEGWFSEL